MSLKTSCRFNFSSHINVELIGQYKILTNKSVHLLFHESKKEEYDGIISMVNAKQGSVWSMV